MKPDPQPGKPLRERDIFIGALDKTPAERGAYLAAECGADAELRRRVEELLAGQDALGGFLEGPALTPVVGPNGTQVAGPVTERPGDRIGRYKLLQVIGEGGCGVVYMAEQEEPVRRRVALKVIKLGMDTKSVIARFEAERQALAMMDHSNIARVFDAGATTAGRPFFVMELVRGVRITDYCDQNHLSNAERLGLFAQVCQAIQHAHQKGIIHRDIKPSNILVTLHDGVPVPKVIDFGIAKATEQRLTEKTLFTQFQSFIGTPAYTSPEQAEMSGLDIDTRSDIYSLGVLLYEILTGRTPFDAERLLNSGLDEMRRIIREEEPLRPSTRLSSLDITEATSLSQARQMRIPVLMQAIQGDLDWIVMKCLEKDRTRRYATANDLAEDIRRYLGNEPVLARSPSNLYRLRKMLRRNRGAFAAAAAVIGTLIVGVTVSTWLAVRATKAERAARGLQQQEASLRHQAEQDKALARQSEYVADINLAQQSLSAGNYGRAVQLLDKHLPQPGEPDLRGFEWRYLWTLSRGDEHVSLPPQRGEILALSVSPDGALLAVGQRDRMMVWNLAARSLVHAATNGARFLAFHPDGKRLFGGSGTTMRSWRVSDWSWEHTLPNSGAMSLSADGRRMAVLRFTSRGRREVQVLNAATWETVATIPDAQEPLALSPDGRRLVADSTATNLVVWTLDGSRPELILQDSTNLFPRMLRPGRSERVLTFSPDGRTVIAARNNLSSRGVFVLSVWDATTGREVDLLPADIEHIEHAGTITGLAFSPDGATLATASMDFSIRLWDFAERRAVDAIQGHINEVLAVTFTPDGRSIITGSKDGEIKVWPSVRQDRDDIVVGLRHPVGFSADSGKLMALTRDFSGGATLNLATRELEQRFELLDNRRTESDLRPPRDSDRRDAPPAGPPPGARPDGERDSRDGRGERVFWMAMRRFQTAVASPDLRWLLHGREDGVLDWVNLTTMQTNQLKSGDRTARVLAIAPDGQSAITRSWERGLRKWDLRAGTNALWAVESDQVLFSPDGRTISVAGPGGMGTRREAVQLWDAATLTVRQTLAARDQNLFGYAAAFSPDSRTIALPTDEDSVNLWDVSTGELLGTFIGHKQGIRSIAFSPDGRTLATTSDDSTLKLWNVATRQELLTLRHLGASLTGLMFSPDGRVLAGGSGAFGPAGGLKLYHAATFDDITRATPASAAP